MWTSEIAFHAAAKFSYELKVLGTKLTGQDKTYSLS